MKKLAGLVVGAALLSAPAMAMDRYGNTMQSARAVATDPDEGLERLAAASTPPGGGHGKPAKSARNILRDDAALQASFAWLHNK